LSWLLEVKQVFSILAFTLGEPLKVSRTVATGHHTPGDFVKGLGNLGAQTTTCPRVGPPRLHTHIRGLLSCPPGLSVCLAGAVTPVKSIKSGVASDV
jgi:hypothetical protein